MTITDTSTSQVLYCGNFSWAVGAHHISSLFTGTGNTLRLRIQESPESGANDNGFIVDNFAVDAVSTTAPSPTPVPTLSERMLGLLVALLAVSVLVARRHRA